MDADERHFDLEPDEWPRDVAALRVATERYCVVLQTLRTPPPVVAALAA